MNIDSLSNSDSVYSVRGKQAQSHRPPPPPRDGDSASRDQVSFESSNRIRQALDKIPEIRPEVVERGRKLAADPNYPPREVVNKIASLITPFPED